MSRLYGLDTLRGLTLVSMIAYHACWDLVWMFGMDWAWYRGQGAFFWQQRKVVCGKKARRRKAQIGADCIAVPGLRQGNSHLAAQT